MKRFNLLLFLSGTILFATCNKNVQEEQIHELKIGKKQLTFTNVASSQKIQIKSSGDYHVEIGEDGKGWCTITKESSGIMLRVSENPESNPRKSKVFVSLKTIKDTINILQLGRKKIIIPNTTAISVPAIGGNKEIEISTNTDYTVDVEYMAGTNWISIIPKMRSKDPVKVSESFNFLSNTEKQKRTAKIILKDKHDENIRAEVFVTQESYGKYNPNGTIDIRDDIKIKVASATASSVQT